MEPSADPVDALNGTDQAPEMPGAGQTTLKQLFERGHAELAAGRLDDAQATCRAMLALDAGHAGALQLLGVVALRAGDTVSAIAQIERAAAVAPTRAEIRHNLGFALRAAGRPADAAAAFREAVALDPDFAEAHYQLGNLARDARRFAEAEASYGRVLALRSDHHQAINNLGVALGELQRFDEAAGHFERAIALKPDYAEAHANLGHALRATGQPEAAEAACLRAIGLAPGFAAAHLNLGLARQDMGRFDEALADFRRASELDPRDAKGTACEGMLHLLRGQFAAGWGKYEARWHLGDLPPRNFTQPQWRGEPLEGRTILLHAEQGFGDTIQFLRYAPLLAARGGKVIVEVQRPLLPLAARIRGVTVLARGEALPAFDLHCPLLSLPLAFGTSLDSIPDPSPYLSPPPDRLAHWREHIGARSEIQAGLKVGIAWAGNPVHRNDRNRSIPLEQLAPLLALAGRRWFALQTGPRAAEAAAIGGLVDLAPALTDFGETAAAIAALDLVISADTAVAHLAGALGKPVWLMLPFAPDWRWLLGRADSPWYKSMRLFRQTRPGDWEGVVAAVREALAQPMAAPSGPGNAAGTRAELEALVRAANEHHQAKRHAECETALRRALEIDPRNASALHVLALTRHALDDTTEAIALMRNAVAIEPAMARFRSDLGIMLHAAERFDEALENARQALTLNPDDAATHNSLGATLSSLQRPVDAMAAYRRALALKPDYYECWTNLAHAQQQLLQLDEAADSYRRALGIKFDYVQAQCSAGMLALLRGDYANGFTQFEWRWRLKVMTPRDFKQPAWQGEPLAGKTILLHAEQGAGDTIQGLRFVPEVAARGGRTVLELPRALARLATSLDGGGEIVTQGNALPQFDVHCAFMSLPRVLGTTLASLPAPIPYLHADPAAVERWSRRLAGARAAFKVGIAWAGNPQHAADRLRSMAIERLAPLLDVPGVAFYSLQVGARSGDLARLPAGTVVDLAPELKTYAETAAAMANLDLVVAVDTSIVHLAGALGRPCWVMLPFAPDWRWLIERTDSPWYPTLRLFRQESPGDWEGVVERVGRALATLAAPQRPPGPPLHAGKLCAQAMELRTAGRAAEAEALGARILASEPDHAATLRLIGVMREEAGDHKAAADLFARAVTLAPQDAEAHYNLAIALGGLDRNEEAIEHYRRAIALAPDHAKAHSNLGGALAAGNRHAEAEDACRAALALDPDSPTACNNLGTALAGQERLAEAADSFRRAAALRPDFAEAHFNLGKTLQSQGSREEALAQYRRAITARPDYANAHLAEAFLLLVIGRDFASGLAKLEWRWRLPGKTPRGFPQPLWQGENLAGKTILLHAEQGFGDSLMLLRYAPLVAARGGRVVIEVPRALERLASRLAGAAVSVIAEGAPLPAFDLHCPLMSLPLAFGTTIETIPAAIPYLAAAPEAVARWRHRLGSAPGMKVGLVWAGNPAHKNDRTRSLKLSRFAPLFDLPGVRWLSLQVGDRASDLAKLNAGQMIDLAADLKDFAETAAAVAALDLVITVDTAVAHLAGALGKPVWILLPFDPDWRWLLDRGDSPWYPTARLVRQRTPGDWDGVIAQVQAALVHCLDAARPAGRGSSDSATPKFDQRYFAAVELIETRREAEAEAAFRSILEENPRHAPTLRRLAFMCHQRGDNADAARLLARSLETEPDNAEAHCNLGLALAALGRRQEAEASYRRGLALKPGASDGHNNLGVLLEELGRYDEAEACYRRAVELAPHLAQPHNNLGVLLKESGQLAASLSAHRRAIALNPDLPAVHSNMLYTLNYDEAVPPQALFKVHQAWGQIPGVRLATEGSRFTNSPGPARRLRIGYVSGDFHHHSAAFFVEPLIEAHARAAVEVFLYANGIKSDAVTARLKTLADHFVSIHGLSDELAAARIRQDAIDILVDLSGHTSGNRMMLFARKPAPVQVSWLGYPNTTGLGAIDYRFTDAVADPPGAADALHTERLVRLERCFLCYRPPAQAGSVAPLPASSTGHVTFGSFNNFAKLSPRTVALWGRLLRELPNARLLLKAPQFKDRGTRERCAAAFAAAGIAAERLDVVPPLATTEEHLSLYGRVDVALDPLPYNGTASTAEALWMGAPVVTLRGDRHASRVGASMLTAIGLEQLVAATPNDYVAIATALARDLGGLEKLRAGLRERMRASPLCDGADFARRVEAAYRAMWRGWCEGQHGGGAAGGPDVADDPAALDAVESGAKRLFDAGNLPDAEDKLRALIARAPQRAQAWFLLGRVRHARGDRDAGVDFLHKAIALDPKHAPAHNDLGILLQNQGRLAEAESCYRRAIELGGCGAEAMSNLGALLAERGRVEDATAWYARAIAADDRFAPAHNNLGAAFARLDRNEESEALHRRALALKPDFADAHYNLGVALHGQGRFEEALSSYGKAVQLKPDMVDARWNRAYVLLLMGNYAEGWREHEWRHKRKEQPPRSYPQPLWHGEPLNGRTILLHAEQGIGDTLQFMRYAPSVAQRGGRVVLQVQRPLQRLAAAALADSAQVIADGDAPPAFDLHCPLLSLPLAFATALESVPAAVPYLPVVPAAAARWRERLGADGFKVGLAWAGNPQHKNDRHRSIGLESLSPLLGISGVRWFSLQVGERAADLARLPVGAITDLSDGLDDFAETAAAVAGLDLVISVDTAVAHLAGALGKAVWVLLPSVPDWRWLIGRDDSPWYPTARIFRQPARGDWESVALSLRQALERQIGAQARPQARAEVGSLLAQASAALKAGDTDAAETALRALIALDPTQARAWNSLGGIAQRREDQAAAAKMFRHALALDKDMADAHNNLGVALHAVGRNAEAIACYRRALALRPDYAKAELNLGVALMDADEPAAAAGHLRQAVALAPQLPETHYNLGNLLDKQGGLEEAASSFRRAAELKPDFYEAHNNLGAVLSKAGEAVGALASFEQALALKPLHAEAHHNVGNALADLGRYEEALLSFRQAIALDPAHVQASFAEARLLLLRGDLRAGFEKYESRWRLATLPPRGFPAPLWNGEDLSGRTILLHAEQGYGDAIQCLRYVPQVAARGRAVLEVPKELLGLARRLQETNPMIANVITRGDALPDFDLQCPLFSLPRAFGTTIETIPGGVPYLSAEPEAIARWRVGLGDGPGPKVGFAWAGSAQHRNDARRSIAIEKLEPLLALAGIRWFALQVGDHAADLARLPGALVTDLSPHLTDFAETAAVVGNLDLVIAVDTALVHLAGALGKPAWVLLRARSDWRWLIEREDSPWYPSLRLFRQRRAGDWDEVVDRVRAALTRMAPSA
jgi:tetratricopeptide (TPR) repeat protein